MTTLYGGPMPPNFTDGEQLTAAGFNAVKNYWVVDGELPETAEDGDVVFVIGEAAGGGELPGIGGWAEVAEVNGIGTKYEYTADGMAWSAFEYTGSTGSVTFSESGLIDALVVDAATGVGSRTDLGGHGGGVLRTVTYRESGAPVEIQVGVSSSAHTRVGLWWSVFGSINGIGDVSGGASGGVATEAPIHGRGVGSRTDGLGQMHAITGDNLGYGGGGGGDFVGQSGYPIPDYNPVYGGGPTPRPNSGGGYGSGYESSRPSADVAGADGVVVIRIPRENDKTGLPAGAFDTTTLRQKAEAAVKQAQDRNQPVMMDGEE